MNFYKICSFIMAVIFAVVGFIFLAFPDATIIAFNSLSKYFNLPQMALSGATFYLALAGAYMYLVTVIAVQMCRFPEEKVYPFLLAHGKLASSLLSIFAFVFYGNYLIFFANFLIDGFIGVFVIFLMRIKRQRTRYGR